MGKPTKTEPWQILVSIAAGPIFVLAYLAVRDLTKWFEELTFAEELGIAAVVGLVFAALLYLFIRLVKHLRKGE